MRLEIAITLRACGTLQTGGRVDEAWVLDAARAVGESALGVVGWSLQDEQIPEALAAVLAAAKRQYEADREAASTDDDIPF